MRILIIGGGNMGQTYARSFVANHTVRKDDLYILERLAHKLPEFEADGFKHIYNEPGAYIGEADLIVLAVKPQDFEVLAPAIRPWLQPGQLVLTIMAGVRMARIGEALGISRIIRAMPNLPAQIGMGMTGFTSADEVGKEELLYVQNLLNTTGKTLYFHEEAKLDAVTAVSGSGPAYVYFFMDAMAEAARNMGFTHTQADMLVEQTFMGAIHLLQRENLSCQEWIARVSSRGGTTEAALKEFNSFTLKDHIRQGMHRALERAIELGK